MRLAAATPRCRQRWDRSCDSPATAEGKIEDSGALLSTFKVQGEKLDLAGWADLLPDAWPAPESGHGAVQVSGTLKAPSCCRSPRRRYRATHDRVAGVDDSITRGTPLEPPEPPMMRPERAPKHPDRTLPAVVEPEEPEPAAPQVLSYSRLAFGLSAKKSNDQWSLTLSDLDATRSDSLVARQSKSSARWSRDEQGGINVSG